MYSSAIYDAVAAPPQEIGKPSAGLVFKGSLEEAQWRKLDTLCDRAQLQPGQQLLDIGFGWGGLSIHAAKVSHNQSTQPIVSFCAAYVLADNSLVISSRNTAATSLVSLSVLSKRPWLKSV